MLSRIGIYLLSCFLFAVPAFSQVTLDANISASVPFAAGSSSVTTTNMAVGTGTNRVLTVSLVLITDTGLTTTCVWDVGGTNQTMTAVTNASVNNVGPPTSAVQWFGLVAPTSGNKTLTCTFTGITAGGTLGATSFNGANQTGGVTTFANGVSSSGQGTTWTLNVTNVANGMAIDVAGDQAGTMSVPLQTILGTINGAGCCNFGSSYNNSNSAGIVGFGWTNNQALATWSEGGFSIAPAPAGAAHNLLLMGVGQ